jgi:hypothetical protein
MKIVQTICKIKDKKEMIFSSCLFKIKGNNECVIYEFGTNLVHAIIKKEFIEYIYIEEKDGLC